MKKILAISGSTKLKSTSKSILEIIKTRYSKTLDINIYDEIGLLPHFNPDLEDNLPDSIQRLRKLISDSDGILFCTPEYVFSLPGSLKNLIEWNVSTVLFSSKPVGLIVAAASGEKAFESLDLILTTIESTIPDKSKLLIQGAKGKVNSNGQIEDEIIISKIDVVISSLISTINDRNRRPTKFG